MGSWERDGEVEGKESRAMRLESCTGRKEGVKEKKVSAIGYFLKVGGTNCRMTAAYTMLSVARGKKRKARVTE